MLAFGHWKRYIKKFLAFAGLIGAFGELLVAAVPLVSYNL